MEDVNIYIETRMKGFRAQKGYYSYVLEFFTSSGEQKTREGFGELTEATETRLVLTAMTEAFSRLTKVCSIRVNTECSGVLSAISNGWVRTWKKNHWKNAKGQQVKNAELWKTFTELASNHLYAFETGQSEFRKWQQEEMEKLEKNGGNKDV